MSEGPIKAWRDSMKPERLSTSPATSTHGVGTAGRAYCGRKTATIVKLWGDVTCADCLAAHRADTPKTEVVNSSHNP